MKKNINLIWVLCKKELASYFNSPIAYIVLAVFLIVGNWLFFNPFFLIKQASLRDYFTLLPWLFLFLAPAITMRSWAEEKHSGTIELLMTWPLTKWQIVLGKFLGAWIFLMIALSLSLTLPLTVNSIGNLDWGPVIGGYIGSILLGGAYLVIGLLISSLTKNQIIAFILGLASCFLLFMISADFMLINFPEIIKPILKFFGLSSHFYNIAKGVIDTKDIVYYLTFISFGLFMNVQILSKKVN